MTIRFYLNNSEETEIFAMHDMQSNPYKLGDDVHISVDDIYPCDVDKFKKNIQEKFYKESEELRNKFNHKCIKLIREGKYITNSLIKPAILTIEYHCEINDIEYKV